MEKFQYGSQVVCADFHLHTCKDKEFQYSGKEDRFVSDYIDALKAKGIDVGVITNHNKFDLGEYKGLLKKARKNDIFLLPGVELFINEGKNGLHVLIIFNLDEWITNGSDFIRNFIMAAFECNQNYENANERCSYDMRTMLEALEKHGKDYFIIFAHVEQDKGLMKECEGGTIKTLARNTLFKKRVLGVQKLRTHDNICKLEQWLGYDVARVEGSDPKRIEEIGKDEYQTKIMLGEYSFNALKYAIADHKNRIYEDIHPLPHSYIESIQFIGGKFDGVKLNLSPVLNTLIGIRGSGKSSILEVLRWVLELPASADQHYKDKLVAFILGPGGKVTVRVVDQYGRKYDISRINGDSVCIVDSEGKDVTVSIGSLIRNPLYFGQKDLTRSDEENHEKILLDKLLGDNIDFHNTNTDMEKIEQQLIDKIKKLQDVAQIPEKIKELEAKNGSVPGSV